MRDILQEDSYAEVKFYTRIASGIRKGLRQKELLDGSGEFHI